MKAVCVAVESRLLGDREAWAGGQRLDVGAARQRCVLVALLLVDVNRLVPTDQLIDRVWSDELPAPRPKLPGRLSTQLRQVIAGDDVEIARQPGGYVLTTDPLSIDLPCFVG